MQGSCLKSRRYETCYEEEICAIKRETTNGWCQIVV